MKKITTLNKLAKRLSAASLLTPGGTATENEIKALPTWKYNAGKYSNEIKGRDIDSDIPIFYVSRSDSYGPYIALRAFDYRNMTEPQKEILSRITELWNK